MTHASPLAFGLPLFAGWFVLVAALPACQSKDEKKSGKIKVTVVVVLAAEDGSEIDPRLKQIADEVRKQSPQLKSFKLKSMTNRSLAEAEKSSFACPDGQKIDITVTHGADMDNRVGLAVVAPAQGEIVYRTVCGKFLPIVTRYQTKDRERLILAIRVQPCQGD